MEVNGLTVDKATNTPIVVLKEKGGERLLPIWIGLVEAQSIALEIEKVARTRPMTHDLLKHCVEALGGEIMSVEVVGLVENTFHASVVVKKGDDVHRIDARPSDAIALALRTGAPIRCAAELIRDEPLQPQPPGDEDDTVEAPPTQLEADLSGPKLIVEADSDLKQMLEKLEPEDFGKYEM